MTNESQIRYLKDIGEENNCRNFESRFPRKSNHNCVNCENIVIDFENDINNNNFDNAKFDEIKDAWCQSERDDKFQTPIEIVISTLRCNNCPLGCDWILRQSSENKYLATYVAEASCPISVHKANWEVINTGNKSKLIPIEPVSQRLQNSRLIMISIELDRVEHNISRRLEKIDEIVKENNKALRELEIYIKGNSSLNCTDCNRKCSRSPKEQHACIEQYLLHLK